MRTISQRELRNDNAEIMREVEAGESFTVTRRGVPIAHLSPLMGESDDSGGLGWAHRATIRPDFSTWARVAPSEPSSVTLDELRSEE